MVNTKGKTKYLETLSRDPAYNLAFEEYVFKNRRDGDYLILWQNDNAVIVGQNQNAEAEIKRDFVEAHGIKVVRRMTGGGAVYHDLGNLNYSFITDALDAETITFGKFTAPVVAALSELGLEASASGRNDITVDGKKVSGTAQRLAGGRVLFHGTLLFDSKSDMIAGALDADPLKFKSKSTKSVKVRVGNIRQMLKRDMTMPEFWHCIKESLGKGGLTEAELTEEELRSVEELKKEKYDTYEWNFGRSPAFSMTGKKRWSGGTLETGINVENGFIKEIGFYGDFMSVRPMDEITEGLRGCRFAKEDVLKALALLPVQECFGGITKEEVTETIFGV